MAKNYHYWKKKYIEEEYLKLKQRAREVHSKPHTETTGKFLDMWRITEESLYLFQWEKHAKLGKATDVKAYRGE